MGFDGMTLNDGLSIPTTSDSLDSNKYETTLDSDPSPSRYGFGNSSIPQEYSFSTTFYTESESMGPSLATLGWCHDTEMLKLYTFVLECGEPFFELLPQWDPTYETPSRVYLDQPKNKQNNQFPCQYPGCRAKQNPFSRSVDLQRHYTNVHADRRNPYICDYANCRRSIKSFRGKNHYRDHLRYFHKEDIGCARSKEMEDKLKSKAKQEGCLEERNVSHKHWRCAKCLVKNSVDQVGWECPSCRMRCEEERIKARERLAEILVPHREISAYPNAHTLPDTSDKYSSRQNETAIKDEQVRKEAAKATLQAQDASTNLDTHLNGSQEEVELRVHQDRGHTKFTYQRPKHQRIYCTQCDSHQEGFRGEHELRRHKYWKHSDPM